MDYISDNENTIKRLKTFGYIILVVVMMFIALVAIALIYSKGTSAETSSANIASIFGFVLLLIIVASVLFKFKDNFALLFTYLSQSSNVIYLILYIIGLIALFTKLSRSDLDTYAYIILPITILLGVYLFYRNIAYDTIVNFNLNFERIKYAIVFACLIIFMSLFYAVDPGGYIKQNFGISLLTTILLAVFGLLYLITIMTFPSLPVSGATNAQNAIAAQSFFTGFTTKGIVSIISFIIFLILIAIGLSNYPGGFKIKDTRTGVIMALVCITLFCSIAYFIATFFTGTPITPTEAGNVAGKFSDINSTIRNVLLLLFGFTFSGILIYWLVNNINNLSNRSGVISFILNLVIVLSILGLVFKLITLGSYYKQSPIYRLIVNTILYIPCIFVSLIDTILSLFGSSKAATKLGKPVESPYTYLALLGLIILSYVVYFMKPYVAAQFSKQGGKLLVNQPVYINKEQNIGTYQTLNGSDKFDYKYAISFWVFIDASSPSTNASYKKYTSILNYGGKPNVLYNGSTNTLMVTMPNTGAAAIGSVTKSTSPPELDDDGNIIIYRKTDVLLQKWNNIIINYNGGTLDVFYNGELVKSVIEVVPYMSYDTLTIGENNGLNGGICNINYFNDALTIRQIYYLYNFIKDKTPPVSTNSNDALTSTLEKAVHIEESKTDTNAVIDSIVKPAEATIEETADENLKPDMNIHDPSNYLSLRWYFAGNGDNFGVP
jgi:hypothetical protein